MGNPMNTMFCGHSYSNKEVEAYLKADNIYRDYKVEYFEDIEVKIAQLLAEFKIVGRFSGKSEWGSRSLCNRGILANASNMSSFYKVNNLVKVRDFWMPFAPTILTHWAQKYIVDWERLSTKANSSFKYMIIAAEGTDLAKKHLIAAMHQKDHTIRPQVIEKRDNNSTYKILCTYENLTGMGGVFEYIIECARKTTRSNSKPGSLYI